MAAPEPLQDTIYQTPAQAPPKRPALEPEPEVVPSAERFAAEAPAAMGGTAQLKWASRAQANALEFAMVSDEALRAVVAEARLAASEDLGTQLAIEFTQQI